MSIRKFFVKVCGGFLNAEEAIDSVSEAKEKYRLLTLATKRFFNTIGPEDILQEKGKVWMCEGKPLSDGEKNLLIAETAQFLNSKLWKVLKTDIQYQANRAMFIKGEDKDDLVAGKLLLYTLDVIKTRLKSLEKGSAIYNVQ